MPMTAMPLGGASRKKSEPVWRFPEALGVPGAFLSRGMPGGGFQDVAFVGPHGVDHRGHGYWDRGNLLQEVNDIGSLFDVGDGIVVVVGLVNIVVGAIAEAAQYLEFVSNSHHVRMATIGQAQPQVSVGLISVWHGEANLGKQ